MSEKIVVTGATGFVGSHILEYFEKSKTDAEVIAACRNKKRLNANYSENAIEGDLKDSKTIEQIAKKADTICHAASWAELNGTFEDSSREFLEPTLELIDAAIRDGVTRFIFLSAITSNPIEQNRLHSKLPVIKLWSHYESIRRIEAHLKKRSDQGMQIIVLKVGFFTGKNYSLGMLPILLPRLKTGLVPWIEKGKTTLPLIDGEDIAQAFVLGATCKLSEPWYDIEIVGREVPSVREVFEYLHVRHGYPLPSHSVSFTMAYYVARFMRFIYRFSTKDPLIVPAVILLLEETHANNEQAKALLGYRPRIDWRQSVEIQIEQMQGQKAMRMNHEA